ncbi:MAG: hypothetical protein CM1200mP39_04140 [Dehalococcoidia bacterium]|nr:MAG: hypothetical protein CM1200mP39_04140 [Dehalococcoidia bacterium]
MRCKPRTSTIWRSCLLQGINLLAALSNGDAIATDSNDANQTYYWAAQRLKLQELTNIGPWDNFIILPHRYKTMAGEIGATGLNQGPRYASKPREKCPLDFVSAVLENESQRPKIIDRVDAGPKQRRVDIYIKHLLRYPKDFPMRKG